MQEVTKRLPNNLLLTFAVAQGITRDALIQKNQLPPQFCMPEKSLKSKSMRNPPIRVGGTSPLRKQEAPSAGAALRAAGKSESDYQSDGRPQFQQ